LRCGAWSLGFHGLHYSITSPIAFLPMIDKSKIIETVHERLKNLPTGHYLDLRTYKRNRSVIIAKMGEDDLLIIENGYFKERFRLKPEKLKKALKTILRKEFPRSRKIRLYVMGRFSEKEALRAKRKVL
jgi:hypothetical protein